MNIQATEKNPADSQKGKIIYDFFHLRKGLHINGMCSHYITHSTNNICDLLYKNWTYNAKLNFSYKQKKLTLKKFKMA